MRDALTCVELSLSPRRFDGWEPKQRTRYSYDDEGRLVEATTTREAEWDDSDRGIIMAAIDIRSDRHQCGHLLSESLRVNPADRPEGYVEPQYVGETRICLACEAEEKYQRKWEQKDRECRTAGAPAYPTARLISVRRVN